MTISIRAGVPFAIYLAWAGAGPSQAKASQAEEMQLVVLRHMAQDFLSQDEGYARRLRFRFFLLLRPGQPPLRLVQRVRPAEDRREQHQERYAAGSMRLREVVLAPTLGARLGRMARAASRGSSVPGSVTFTCGQIRWDGSRQAIVEASCYNTGPHGACSLEGYSYQLQKVSGRWRVLGRCRTAAAG